MTIEVLRDRGNRISDLGNRLPQLALADSELMDPVPDFVLLAQADPGAVRLPPILQIVGHGVLLRSTKRGQERAVPLSKRSAPPGVSDRARRQVPREEESIPTPGGQRADEMCGSAGSAAPRR